MAERVERRLTTIIAADVAEYSRLMRADEDGTLAALTTCRAIIDKLIAEHRGRIANTAGDSVLAELPSVAEGLSCALAIQKALGKHSERLPLRRQMRFRIGVHLGDVMIRSGDMFRDAVNIAARLQALAEPGGICVSAAVREHIGTRNAATFADAGAQQGQEHCRAGPRLPRCGTGIRASDGPTGCTAFARQTIGSGIAIHEYEYRL
ncbi:MAG: adenylate/guanylate cyclase domain-containing protein [Alphaproteobacteria bacterium]|nr:adenylate/guanylate cyclase domain-containing protein [Alphaproteobacteria bacterium]MBV9378332.1 adenylate/guanylate cyclase domain-containing protein [Alphaproteobacteria bacterium]